MRGSLYSRGRDGFGEDVGRPVWESRRQLHQFAAFTSALLPSVLLQWLRHRRGFGHDNSEAEMQPPKSNYPDTLGHCRSNSSSKTPTKRGFDAALALPLRQSPLTCMTIRPRLTLCLSHAGLITNQLEPSPGTACRLGQDPKGTTIVETFLARKEGKQEAGGLVKQ